MEVFPGLVMLFWSPLKNYPSSRKSSGSILRADKQSGLVLKGFWGICAGIGLNIMIKAKAGLQNTDYCTQDCLFCLYRKMTAHGGYFFFFLVIEFADCYASLKLKNRTWFSCDNIHTNLCTFFWFQKKMLSKQSQKKTKTNCLQKLKLINANIIPR